MFAKNAGSCSSRTCRRRRTLHRRLCLFLLDLAKLARPCGAFRFGGGGTIGLNEKSFVVEAASNDGYLLQFVAGRGIPCLGIEPTASTAAAARLKGIDTEEIFLGEATARLIVGKRRKADLVVANNVLAHVPDINDFVRGIRELLAAEGVAVFEFPHLLRLIEGLQFDTIYHEHYSYLSLYTAARIREGGAPGFRCRGIADAWRLAPALRLS